MSDWVKWLLLGLLSIAFGVFVLGAPVVASVAVTVVTGVLLLIAGGLQIVGGFTVEGTGNKILSLIMGAVMLFLGWSFLDHPLQGTLTLATVVLILFMAGGIARIILSFQMKGTQFFWPTMISGILSITRSAWPSRARAEGSPPSCRAGATGAATTATAAIGTTTTITAAVAAIAAAGAAGAALGAGAGTGAGEVEQASPSRGTA